jgi:site-specific DNA-methyltransferase (adenine-specific)
MIELNRIYNEDCLTGMRAIDDSSIDCILTDPPYLYLKNQKLDRPFDEVKFFNEAKRVLKPNGFIVLFGRGTSFYRWNTRLAELGFTFKEEIVWNKVFSSSPVLPVQRFHESISFHTVSGKIRKCKIPYIELKQFNIDGVIGDVKRIKSALNNTDELDAMIDFLSSRKKKITKKRNDKAYAVTISSNSTGIFSVSASVLSQILDGGCERSIIDCVHDRYTRIHPTQKPVRLLERLLALATKEGDLVLDPFSGSASTAIAAYNTDRNFIGFEIDEEYYGAGMERLNSVLKTPKQKELFGT